jgi:tetratricopeptide (TPR) repeat protein
MQRSVKFHSGSVKYISFFNMDACQHKSELSPARLRDYEEVISCPKVQTDLNYIYKIKGFNALFLKIVLLLLFAFSVHVKQAQSIIDIIDKTAGASFTIVAHSANMVPMDTVRAFFISADGLAITSASVFRQADTLLLTDHRNRPMTLSRIIAIHPYANLALVQVAGARNRETGFLIPSRNSFEAAGEVLVFANGDSRNDGLIYGYTNSIIHPFFLGRCATITANAGYASRGAPVINSTGQFIGVYNHLSKPGNSPTIFSVHILDDNRWISVNQPWPLFKRNGQKHQLSSAHIMEALCLQAMDSWLESARSFNEAIRLTPNDARLYGLRSLSRHNYGNNVGGREDFTLAVSLNSNEPIPYIARAMFHLKSNQYNFAANDLLVCAEMQEEHALTYYLLGQLQTINKDVRKAYASFSYALELDSLFDAAYYERGKLMLQHSSDHGRAFVDLRQAARLNPRLEGVHTLIGNIRMNRLDYLGAIAEYDMAIRMNQGDAHALMNRGMAYFNTGLKQRACEDWDRAGKLGNTQAFRLISRHCSQNR